MNSKKRDPWLLYLISNISNVSAFLTLFGIILYFTVSRQGISLYTVFIILRAVGIISFISLILLLVKLIFLIIKDRRVLKKIKMSIPLLLTIVLIFGIFVFSNAVYVLSKGYVE